MPEREREEGPGGSYPCYEPQTSHGTTSATFCLRSEPLNTPTLKRRGLSTIFWREEWIYLWESGIWILLINTEYENLWQYFSTTTCYSPFSTVTHVLRMFCICFLVPASPHGFLSSLGPTRPAPNRAQLRRMGWGWLPQIDPSLEEMAKSCSRCSWHSPATFLILRQRECHFPPTAINRHWNWRKAFLIGTHLSLSVINQTLCTAFLNNTHSLPHGCSLSI